MSRGDNVGEERAERKEKMKDKWKKIECIWVCAIAAQGTVL